MPEIHNAVHITSEGFEGPEPINIVAEVAQHLGEGRVRTVAMTATEGVVRGMKARRSRRTDRRAGGPRNAGARDERARRARGWPRPGPDGEALSDSPAGAVARGSIHRARNVRNGHQGRGPVRTVPEGRQDRPLRRRGRRQDGSDSGADPQRRDEAWRRVGVRRRGRAHARRQRPVARNAGIGRRRSRQFGEIARGADLRPDDGTARRAPARGTDRPDRRGIFPR